MYLIRLFILHSLKKLIKIDSYPYQNSRINVSRTTKRVVTKKKKYYQLMANYQTKLLTSQLARLTKIDLIVNLVTEYISLQIFTEEHAT